jgi:hypothetical protein
MDDSGIATPVPRVAELHKLGAPGTAYIFSPSQIAPRDDGHASSKKLLCASSEEFFDNMASLPTGLLRGLGVMPPPPDAPVAVSRTPGLVAPGTPGGSDSSSQLGPREFAVSNVTALKSETC